MSLAVTMFYPGQATASQVAFGPESRAECLYGSGQVQVSSYYYGQKATYIYVWYIDRSSGQWRLAHEGHGLGVTLRVPAFSTVNVDVYMLDLPGQPGWALVRTSHLTAANWGQGLEMRNTGDQCYS